MSDDQSYNDLLDETVTKLDRSLIQQQTLIAQQGELIDQKHEMIDEVKALRTSNRTLRAILTGVVGLLIVGAVATVLSVAGLISVHNTVNQQNVDRVAGCQVRNANTKTLFDSQLEESLANVDSLVASILPTAQDPARTQQIAEQWKAKIRQSHNERSSEVVFVDCNLNDIKGDVGDFPPSTTPQPPT